MSDDSPPGDARPGRPNLPPSRLSRHALWLVALALLVPQLIGSAFNIWYNLAHIEPLLSAAQRALFARSILIYNLAVYPPLTVLCLWIVFALHRPLKRILRGETVPEAQLVKARCRTINLPWLTQAVSAIGWLGCIPFFLLTLRGGAEALDPRIYWHLPISFFISACIAITQAFFAIELLSQRVLFPLFFKGVCPAGTPGACALSLRGRGLMWAISAGICPILSLLLLILAPGDDKSSTAWFALSVAGLSIAFGLVTVLLLGRLVTEPVDALREAAQDVTKGRRDVCVPLLRADEFGPLIEDFNHMVVVLCEKEDLLQEAQDEILERLAQAAEFRDHDTGDHTARVGKMAALLAKELSFEAGRSETLLRAAPLHDVGKIGIPDDILLKPGRLTPEELAIMQTHTTIGARLLSDGNSALMGMAQLIAHAHHEKWNGSGYPRGLSRHEIPIEGCIVSVVDVFDALTHARPYKKAWPVADALQEIEKLSGSHFCPEVARAFLRLSHQSLL
jgi:HAMP domain-containing protein